MSGATSEWPSPKTVMTASRGVVVLREGRRAGDTRKGGRQNSGLKAAEEIAMVMDGFFPVVFRPCHPS